MSAPINDGGPAFPHAQRLWDNDAQSWAVHSVGGMTLRDWLAGKALQGLMPTLKINDESAIPLAQEKCAEWAYGFADAMLAARAKGQQ